MYHSLITRFTIIPFHKTKFTKTVYRWSIYLRNMRDINGRQLCQINSPGRVSAARIGAGKSHCDTRQEQSPSGGRCDEKPGRRVCVAHGQLLLFLSSTIILPVCTRCAGVETAPSRDSAGGFRGGSRRVWRALGTTTTPETNQGNRAHDSIPFCFTFYCPTWIRPIYIKRYVVVTSVDWDCGGDVRGMFLSCVLYHLRDAACRLSRKTWNLRCEEGGARNGNANTYLTIFSCTHLFNIPRTALGREFFAN